MSEEMVRTHIVIPKTLLATIDELVGHRSRSKFLVEAAEKEIRRRKLAHLAERVGGSLENVEIPGWETSETAARWVRDSRQADRERLDRGLNRR